MHRFNLKYVKAQLGPIIPALIIGMLVFSSPKILMDCYKVYKDLFIQMKDHNDESSLLPDENL